MTTNNAEALRALVDDFTAKGHHSCAADLRAALASQPQAAGAGGDSCHDAIARALDEASVRDPTLRGMALEVGLEVFAERIAATPAPAVEREAVKYEQRTRPEWDERAPWSKWEECSRAAYEQCARTPRTYNGWLYEVRALYTTPQATPREPVDDARAVEANHDEALQLAHLKRDESNLARCYIELATRPSAAPEPSAGEDVR